MDIKKVLIQEIAEHMGIERSKVLLETSFKELGADSLDELIIIMIAEEALQIELPDEVLTETSTVGEFVQEVSNMAGIT